MTSSILVRSKKDCRFLLTVASPPTKKYSESLVHSMLLLLATHAVNVIYWKLQWSLSPPNHSQCPQLNGCEQTICFLVCVGRNYIDSSYDIGFLQSFRGPKPFPIDHNCSHPSMLEQSGLQKHRVGPTLRPTGR